MSVSGSRRNGASKRAGIRVVKSDAESGTRGRRTLKATVKKSASAVGKSAAATRKSVSAVKKSTSAGLKNGARSRRRTSKQASAETGASKSARRRTGTGARSGAAKRAKSSSTRSTRNAAKADARKKVASLTGRANVRSNGKPKGSRERNGYKKSDRRAAERQSKRRAPSRIAGALFRSDAPEWSDLVEIGNQRLESESEPAFGAISTVRFVLAVLAVAGIFTLYVGHVYSTQELLADVQAERRENLALRLQLNRTKGLYDAATGPAAVYERAHGLGLEENAMSGPPIRVPDE